ncbi:MAG: CDP-diacylglycerol--glycerol-3-phosphate 3-phosphatidyltransferase [Candidatus Babeliales bacterium]
MELLKFNIPTWLTLIRLFSPLVLPVFLVYLAPFNIWWLNFLLGFLFILFAATDFFDGYLARKYNQETALGKILDPIADKFLLYATLISLLTVGKIYFYWVIILIGREIFIMGLRYIAVDYHLSISVSWLAKVKTMMQMIFLFYLIITPYHALGLRAAPGWNGLELIFLTLTVSLSLLTAYQYYENFMRQFKSQLELKKNKEEDDNEVYSSERSI